MSALDLFKRPDPVQTWQQHQDAEDDAAAALAVVDRSGWEDFGIVIIHGHEGAPQVLILPVPKTKRTQGNMTEPGGPMQAYSRPIH